MESDSFPSSRRKYGDLRAVRETYGFATTHAYELLKLKKIAAKKLGRKTLFDFASIDAYIASLPDFEGRQ